MMRSLFAAVSGLRNHQMSLSVIGNNIANINTIGFKSGRALFTEMLAETMQGASRPLDGTAGTNPIQVGLGMSVASVSNQFSQGQLQLTGNMMDMAVQGDGFFVMRDGDREFFGRAGAFGFDGQGRLTAGQGLILQGWRADQNGVIGSGTALNDIELPFGQKSAAAATTSIRLQSNLDAAAEALNTITRTNPLLATAQATDSLETLFNSQGQTLGIQSGDVIRVQYAGTSTTRLSNLATESGAPLDLQAGDLITVSTGSGAQQTLPAYDPTWTLDTLAFEVEQAILANGTETDITVGVNDDGSLLFTNPSGGNNTDVVVTLSAPGRTVFNSLVASVPVINGTATARSAKTIVEVKLTNNLQFSNMNELAAALQGAMRQGSSGASVVFQNGQFTYANPDDGSSQALRNLSITRPGATTFFADAMGLVGQNLLVDGTAVSDLLLDTADASDNLIDLHDPQGTDLGLTLGDVFTFDARVGGVPISQSTFSIVNTGDGANDDRAVETLGGLLEELKDVLGLRTAGDVYLDGGSVVIEGRSGLAAEITNITITETNNPDLSTAFAFAETQAATDVTHEASIRVFDALGSEHLLTMVFTKDTDSDNRWTWAIDFEDGEITSGGTGAVTFNGDGTLDAFTTDQGLPLRIDPTTGAEGPMIIDFHAGTRNGLDGITGYARESTTAIVDQDGYGMGTLESISVAADGIITGVFTNGTSRALAQMALANFKNPSGLQKDGRDGWITTANSGEAVIRRPGTDSEVGAISAGTLEMSNVDIAQEFTNMIVAQRGFQANARTVTTSDEMLVELVNLKR